MKESTRSLENMHLDLDGLVTGGVINSIMQLSHYETGDVVLSTLAQYQLLEFLYQRRGVLYCAITPDIEGSDAPAWVQDDLFIAHRRQQDFIDSTLAVSSNDE